MSDNEKIIHPIDSHVGSRVRIRRKFLSLSQTELAAATGITFQQIQKYEKGTNRISASKLHDIAKMLKTPISYFFEQYGEAPSDTAFSESHSERTVQDFLISSEGVELSQAFPRIRSAKQRRRVLELVRTLAGEE